jgi:hypothetical protein
MTPLERLVLSRIFESEEDGNRLYFLAGECASEVVVATRAESEEALSSRPDPNSTAHRCVTEQLAEAQADTTEIELDFAGTSWEPFFQDIVRRSRTLRHVTVVSAFTCSKMRPDGFGGMATIITRDAVLGKSTNDIIEDFFAQTDLDSTEAVPISQDADQAGYLVRTINGGFRLHADFSRARGNAAQLHHS